MLRGFLLIAQYASDFLAENSIALLHTLLFFAMEAFAFLGTFQALVQCLESLDNLYWGNLGLLRLRLGLRGRYGSDGVGNILRPSRSETKGVRATYNEPVRLIL